MPRKLESIEDSIEGKRKNESEDSENKKRRIVLLDRPPSSLLLFNGAVELRYNIIGRHEVSGDMKKWFLQIDSEEAYNEANVEYDFALILSVHLSEKQKSKSWVKDGKSKWVDKNVGFCTFSYSSSRRERVVDYVFDVSSSLAMEYKTILTRTNLLPRCKMGVILQLVNSLGEYTATRLFSKNEHTRVGFLKYLDTDVRNIIDDHAMFLRWKMDTHIFEDLIKIVDEKTEETLRLHSKKANISEDYNIGELAIRQIRIDERIKDWGKTDIFGFVIKILASCALDNAISAKDDKAIIRVNPQTHDRDKYLHSGFKFTKYSSWKGSLTTVNLLKLVDRMGDESTVDYDELLSEMRGDKGWSRSPLAMRLSDFLSQTGEHKYGSESSWTRNGKSFELVSIDITGTIAKDENFDRILEFCSETNLSGMAARLVREGKARVAIVYNRSSQQSDPFQDIVGIAFYFTEVETKQLDNDISLALKSPLWMEVYYSLYPVLMNQLRQAPGGLENSISLIISLARYANAMNWGDEDLDLIKGLIKNKFPKMNLRNAELRELVKRVLNLSKKIASLEVSDEENVIPSEKLFDVHLELVCIDPMYSGYGILAAVFRFLVFTARNGWIDEQTETAYITLVPINNEKRDVYGSMGFVMKQAGSLQSSFDLTKKHRPGLRIYEN